MSSYKGTQNEPQRFKKSMLAVCIVTLSAPTFAQTDEAVDEIVISGVRQSLINAQTIKKNADTFVDAISASDIGALPDKSVLEALQRVPGVSIERYAAATDPDHFSIEGSGVTLRGLPQTRSEFNGRDSFSANSGRGLSFSDVPPELMSKVEVYKNQTADLIEGGISGSINLNTRKPFDSASRIVAFSAAANYADLAKETKPSFSGLYSDRWETAAGEFGLLVSVAKSELTSRTDGVSYGQVANNANNDGDVPDPEKLHPSDVTIDGKTVSRFVGINAAVRNAVQERNREGASLVAQWRSPDDTLLSTFEYMRSDSGRNWMEHNVEADDKTSSIINPVYNNTYLTKGTYTGVDAYTSTTRFQDHKSLVEDFSLNFVYTPTDELTVKADFQHIKAKTDEKDLSIQSGVIASTDIDFSDVKKPSVLMKAPVGSTVSDAEYFSNPANYFWRSAMDHLDDSSANENAAKLDVKYTLDAGWAKSVETGIRFADREQNTQWSNYNWGNLSESWAGQGRKYFDGIQRGPEWSPSSAPYDHNAAYQTVSGREGLFRDSGTGISGGSVLAPSESLVRNYAAFIDATTKFGYKPAGYRDGLAKGPFKLNEITDITERNRALYVKLNFGNEDETLTGNLGLRYVIDKVDSVGGTSYANPLSDGLKAQLLTYYTAKNDLKTYNEQVAWHNGGTDPKLTESSTFSKLLPSLNVKYAFTDELVGRFAVSEAVSYPDMGNMRNYKSMNSTPTLEHPAGDQSVVSNVLWSYNGGGGNPHLKPMESTNYDLSLEWYFGPSNSVFAGLFQKDMKNFFSADVIDTPITNNGVTRVVSLSIPGNIGTSKITGFEVGYQQFFDMLPAPFDGLGLQANLTLIDQSGQVPNSSLDPATPPDGAGGGNLIPPTFGKLPLQGMSKTTYNIVAMYDKDAISARVAWNWRSEYLLTSRDTITKAPIFAQASGQMDASVFYKINDNFKVGLEGANLLDEMTWTKMQVDEAGTKVPRNFFVNDRRVSLILKGQF
jgi:iron complex outermembrane recepter protein